MLEPQNGLITTIKEHCRMCYTCVRECPAKAIRITDGQAEVLGERCIACGNCVRVCSRHAKHVRSGIGACETLLAGPDPVAVCLAPSFPAEFEDVDYPLVVGLFRQLGFAHVVETAAGADLVAQAYHDLLRREPDARHIATTCPAVVGYIERYYPELVPLLAPIVSPMIAIGRMLRAAHGSNLKIAFVGPCIAKKDEALSPELAGEIDVTLTFAEVRQMLNARQLSPETVTPAEFDPPHAGKGTLFPIARGMLETAKLRENLLNDDIIAASGRHEFTEVIKEFAGGHLQARLLEILCCDGCIMGAGMTTDAPQFRRRSRIGEYARLRTAVQDVVDPVETAETVDLSRSFIRRDIEFRAPSPDAVRAALERMGKTSLDDELNCGACGYATCVEHAIAMCEGLAESEMCLPYAIDELRQTCDKLAKSNEELAVTREALIQSEKLASMGQLAAGIAHEVNNPLGTVLMLSNVLLEELDSASELREDLGMIASEANRCKKIVAGLLQFARQNKVDAQPTNLRDLLEHLSKTLAVPDNVRIELEQHTEDVTAEIDSDQILQVLTNLSNNALNAMPDGGQLTLSLGGDTENVVLEVKDEGTGIPEALRRKIFEPFFTTKKAGKGTGLGLAVTYGIVKIHRGDIRVSSNADAAVGPTGTTFTITLPRCRKTA